MTTRSRFEGAMFGLAAGDAFCAAFEGGILERLVWSVIGKTLRGKRRWTDDTQMSLDLAASLIENRGIDQDDIAVRFANSYRWSRGYGRGAAKILRRIKRGMDWEKARLSVFPDGSYGNGGAMRSPVIGLCFHREMNRIDESSRQAAEVTHAHPSAIEGARLIAHATALAGVCDRPDEVWNELKVLQWEASMRAKLDLAHEWSKVDKEIEVRQIRSQLGNGIAAMNSVVTSVYFGLSNASNSFEQLAQRVTKVGGDTDTIASMAGAIWGALRGIEELPKRYQVELEGESLIRQTANDLFDLAIEQRTE